MAAVNTLPFGKTGKSQLAMSLVKKKICLHLVLICSPAEKPKTTFYGCGQTASSFQLGMIKRSASPRPTRFAFHFQLVQSSLTLKMVAFHLCNENFPVGDRLGEVFVGEALNLVEHLTHSQGHLPCCFV